MQQGYIYKLVKFNNEYKLEQFNSSFKIPTKLYGNLDKMAARFWRAFISNNKTMGVMLTGDSGSGKTVTMELLSNYGIVNGFNVIIVTDIKADIELINFIDSLDKCIILFDEFGKNFGQLQEKMLTMFNDLKGNKKLFLITDNDVDSISSYIRNRPGRVKYHVDFRRIKESVIDEYCMDYNVDMKSKFYIDLMRVYNKALVFSFDHLQHLVEEHLNYPDESFEELLSILNLDILSKESMLLVKDCYVLTKDGDKVIKTPLEVITSSNLSLKNFTSGRNMYIRFINKDKNEESTHISVNDLTEYIGSFIKCIVNDKYEVNLLIDE